MLTKAEEYKELCRLNNKYATGEYDDIINSLTDLEFKQLKENRKNLECLINIKEKKTKILKALDDKYLHIAFAFSEEDDSRDFQLIFRDKVTNDYFDIFKNDFHKEVYCFCKPYLTKDELREFLVLGDILGQIKL